MTTAETAWVAGRLDGRRGPKSVLFGRMYEDVAVERGVLRPGGRVFCIASAGCTAMALSEDAEVVACDINPAQLAYAEERIRGGAGAPGAAERVMAFARVLMPIAGWTRGRIDAFLSLSDPAEQVRVWTDELDTWRFRTGFDALLSAATLRASYSRALVDVLPRPFGRILRARMQRAFSRHPNANNPYAHALLGGSLVPDRPSPVGARIDLVHADAASHLESCPERAFDGFTLSNILDGASPAYRARLSRAVRRAARKDAVVVLRSFAEPTASVFDNRAADDRSMLWGVVDVRPAEAGLPTPREGA